MNNQLHFDLSAAARRAMLAHGFEPDFPPAVAQQLQQLHDAPAARESIGPRFAGRAVVVHRQRHVEGSGPDRIRRRRAGRRSSRAHWHCRCGRLCAEGIADRPACAARDDDRLYRRRHFPHAARRALDRATSLLPDQERAAVVVEFTVDAQAQISNPSISLARVTNKAQLAYPSVGAWLAGPALRRPKVAASQDLQQQLHMQDAIAQRLRRERSTSRRAESGNHRDRSRSG